MKRKLWYTVVHDVLCTLQSWYKTIVIMIKFEQHKNCMRKSTQNSDPLKHLRQLTHSRFLLLPLCLYVYRTFFVVLLFLRYCFCLHLFTYFFMPAILSNLYNNSLHNNNFFSLKFFFLCRLCGIWLRGRKRSERD